MRLAAGAEADAIEAAVTLIRQYPGVTGVGREEGNVLTVDFDGGRGCDRRACSNSSRRAPRWWTSTARPSTWKKVFMEVTQGE